MSRDGEPLSRGRVDRRVVDGQALRDTVLFVAIFTVVVLVNGILAILFIALMQALGWWSPVAAEAASCSAEGVDEVRSSLQALTDRPPSGTR